MLSEVVTARATAPKKIQPALSYTGCERRKKEEIQARNKPIHIVCGCSKPIVKIGTAARAVTALAPPAPFSLYQPKTNLLNRFSTFCIGFRHNPIRKFYNQREIKNIIGAYYQYIPLVR